MERIALGRTQSFARKSREKTVPTENKCAKKTRKGDDMRLHTTMARKRNSLLAAFPPATITPSEASDALRQSVGDVEAAKRILEARSGRNVDDNNKPAAEPVDPQRATAPADSNLTKGQLENDKATVLATTTTTTNSTKDQLGNKRATAPAVGATTNNNNSTRDRLVRIQPRTSTRINNLSDRQYCCVWHVEVYEDGYRPDVARSLLARVARHVNPILRARGWRVKRLLESSSKQWIGLCTGNGRNDADAASTNIQLNLRVAPSKYCKTFRTFSQILSVMLHEITHTSIGLEDIHPPAFYELLEQIKAEYIQCLENKEVDLETDDYGCSANVVTVDGQVKTVREAASNVLGNTTDAFGQFAPEECGASKRRSSRRRFRGGGTKRSSSSGFVSNLPKKRPLLKGSKMIDQRTKAGKALLAARRELTPRELAARAALERFGTNNNTTATVATEGTAAVGLVDKENHNTSNDESQDGSDQESEDEEIEPHIQGCGCRGCGWERMFMPAEPST
jgi:hypothetical protein